MRFFKLFALFPLFFLSTCSTNTDGSAELNLEGSWQREGLEELRIQKIKRSPDFMYAATDSGMHRRPLAGNEKGWQQRGLQEEMVRDFVSFSNDSLLAGIQLFDTASPEPTLFLTEDSGATWKSYQNNFGGERQYGYFSAITQHPKNSAILFAKGNIGTIAKSNNKGKNWQLLHPKTWDTGGFSYFIKINDKNPMQLWTGGRGNIPYPVLIKSTDAGKSWQYLTVVENVETTVYDVETHPTDVNRVIAGLGGGIRKSTDGGQSWHTALEDVNIYSMTKSAKDDRIVYAAGEIQSGRIAFFASGDFGDTWQQVTMEEGPGDLFVLDIVTIMQDGREVLYLGATQGVYSYAFAE